MGGRPPASLGTVEGSAAAILRGTVITGTGRRQAPKQETEPGAAGAPTPSRRRVLVQAAIVVALAVVLAIVLRTFVVGTYLIPSGSMEPTLMINDRIMVDKLSYDLHSIHRGDIVVFSTPPAENCGGPPVADLVKRVIGLPGDTVSLSAGRVYIDGKLLAEPWFSPGTEPPTTPGPSSKPYALRHPFKVPAHDVYVMGDNRTVSCDSRYWGPILQSSIVGKVDLRFWPVSRIHFF
jgi:signal peptidase I